MRSRLLVEGPAAGAGRSAGITLRRSITLRFGGSRAEAAESTSELRALRGGKALALLPVCAVLAGWAEERLRGATGRGRGGVIKCMPISIGTCSKIHTIIAVIEHFVHAPVEVTT
jgi:hypothetical protein